MVGITAAFALAIPRWAFPNLYPDEQGWGGLAYAMRRAFLHFDFGLACGWVGCPKVSDMWLRGYAADVWMLLGTVAIGVGAGFALGLWCAGRRTRGARASSREAPCPVLHPGVRPRARRAPPVPSDVRHAAAAVLLRRRADPGLAAVVAVGLVPLAARALARGGGATRGDVPAARRRAAPGAAGHRPRADRDCEGRAAQAGDPPPCRPVRACGDRVAGRRERADRRAQPDPRRAGLRRAGLLRCTLEGDGRARDGYQDGFRGGKPPAIDLEMLAGIAIWASLFVVVLSFAMEFALLRLDPRVRTARQL